MDNNSLLGGLNIVETAVNSSFCFFRDRIDIALDTKGLIKEIYF